VNLAPVSQSPRPITAKFRTVVQTLNVRLRAEFRPDRFIPSLALEGRKNNVPNNT